MKLPLGFTAGLILCAIVLIAFSQSVRAAPQGLTFNVNDTADEPDANPGNSLCATAGGKCTLRAAIMEANALSSAETINLQPNATYTITRVGNDATALNGDFDVLNDLTINGNHATIDANGAVTGDRAFQIQGGAVVILSEVTIQHGACGRRGRGGSSSWGRGIGCRW